VQRAVPFGDQHRLQFAAEHHNKSLTPLYTVEGVVKAVLSPYTPASIAIAAERQAVDMHRLVQQLEVGIATGTGHGLQCEFAYANRAKKVKRNGTNAENNQYL